MKVFEIPYNFDKQLINLLYQIDPKGISYHSIYIPPYLKDYKSAKSNYINKEHPAISNFQKLNEEEYYNHINYIKRYFPNKLMLLLQQNNYIMENNILQKYINLGFTKFCVGNIEQAKIIRNLIPNSEIIGSITMKIKPQDLLDETYKIFDGFVLYFPYNRKFSIIKNLPKQYKYILLVNCDCNIYCQGTSHWFASAEEEKIIQCPNQTKFCWENIIRIDPKDLSLFDPYIFSYKLQGREFSTEKIFYDLLLYKGEYKELNPKLIIDESKYENKNFDF